MWCERENSTVQNRVEDIITYFEGTCEFCIGNLGIDKYLQEIRELIMQEQEQVYSERDWMLLYYALGVIEYKLDHLDKASKAWRMALMHAEALQDEIIIPKVQGYMAIFEYVNGNFDRAKKLFELSVQSFVDRKSYSEAALMYVNILWYKRYEPNKLEVLSYMDKALEYVQMADDMRNARIYLHIGYIYKTIFNDFGEGISHLMHTAELCKENGNVEMQCMAYHVMADGYMQIRQYKRTITIYNALLEREEYQSITPILKGMIRTNLSLCYILNEQYEQALDCAVALENLVLEMRSSFQEQFKTIVLWLKSTCLVYLRQHLDIARKLLDDCNAMNGACENSIAIGMFDYKIWGTYGELYKAQGIYLDAISAYKTQLKCAAKYGLWEQKSVYESLAEIYQLQGETSRAKKYRAKSEEVASVIQNDYKFEQYNLIYDEYFAKLNLKE